MSHMTFNFNICLELNCSKKKKNYIWDLNATKYALLDLCQNYFVQYLTLKIGFIYFKGFAAL